MISALLAAAAASTVAVPTRDIAPGEPLTEDAVAPRLYRSPGVGDDPLDVSEVLQRVAKVPLLAGEPILASRLTEGPAPSGLGSIVAPGRRLALIPVEPTLLASVEPGTTPEFVCIRGNATERGAMAVLQVDPAGFVAVEATPAVARTLVSPDIQCAPLLVNPAELSTGPVSVDSKDGPTTGPVVAARDVPAGTEISASDLVAAPSGGGLPAERLLGRTVASPVFAGEGIRAGRLADISEGRGLQALVPRGMRGVSVEVEGASLVQPRESVDVLAPSVQLESVFVLGRPEPGVLTLLLTPRQAELLVKARLDEVPLGVSIRNADDVEVIDAEPAPFEGLFEIRRD